MVGVDLINELLRKSGGGAGLFKEGDLNLLKNWTWFMNNTLFNSVNLSMPFKNDVYDTDDRCFRFIIPKRNGYLRYNALSVLVLGS